MSDPKDDKAGQPEVLSVLDNAKVSLFHFKAIVVAGAGFFTDAYDLFSISLLTKIIGRIYYQDSPFDLQDYVGPGKLPIATDAAVSGVALCGTLAGQLFFGTLGDMFGRKAVYGIVLAIMIISAICQTMSFGRNYRAVIGTLCWWRFMLGFGVGGDYPLSATIMSEYSSRLSRGAFVSAVFAQQGTGILTAATVSIIVVSCFRAYFPGGPYPDKQLVLGTLPMMGGAGPAPANWQFPGCPVDYSAAAVCANTTMYPNGCPAMGAPSNWPTGLGVPGTWAANTTWPAQGPWAYQGVYGQTVYQGPWMYQGTATWCDPMDFNMTLVLCPYRVDLVNTVYTTMGGQTYNLSLGIAGSTNTFGSTNGYLDMAFWPNCINYIMYFTWAKNMNGQGILAEAVGSVAAPSTSQLSASASPITFSATQAAWKYFGVNRVNTETGAPKILDWVYQNPNAQYGYYSYSYTNSYAQAVATTPAALAVYPAAAWWNQSGTASGFSNPNYQSASNPGGLSSGTTLSGLIAGNTVPPLGTQTNGGLTYYASQGQATWTTTVTAFFQPYNYTWFVAPPACSNPATLGMPITVAGGCVGAYAVAGAGSTTAIPSSPTSLATNNAGAGNYFNVNCYYNSTNPNSPPVPCALALNAASQIYYQELITASTPSQSDWVWRIVLLFGFFPASCTMYIRATFPETPRFTLHVQGDKEKLAKDMGGVVKQELDSTTTKQANPDLSFGQFMRKHGKELVGCAMSWFLLDVAFYSQNLFQKDVFTQVNWLPGSGAMNAFTETFKVARAQALISLGSTIPGYWFTVFTVDFMGRLKIQLMGFVIMTALMAALAGAYLTLLNRQTSTSFAPTTSVNGFITIYALTFFFANWGPNATTFVIPAELFPTSWKSTAHGFSAASGKAGAIIGAFGFLFASRPLSGEYFWLPNYGGAPNVPWLWKPNCADGKGTKLYTPANMPYGLDFLIQPASTNSGYMSNYAGGTTGGGLYSIWNGQGNQATGQSYWGPCACHPGKTGSWIFGTTTGSQQYYQNLLPTPRSGCFPEGVGLRASLGILAATNFLGMLFTFLLPETNGKTLEELSGETAIGETAA